MRYLNILSFLILCSCNDDGDLVRKKIGNAFVEAHFINDSIVNGEAKVYNSEGHIVSIQNYDCGIKNGVSINFHSNGKVYDSISFFDGLQNGYHFVYDSSGMLGYLDFYFYGHQLGPEVFYKNGIANSFFFTSFEKFEIFNVSYDSIGRMGIPQGKFINASVYRTKLNGNPAVGIFSYFIYPPTLAIQYKLVLRDSLTRQEIEVREFQNSILIDTVLERPNANSVYCIKAIIRDSLGNSDKLFYEDLIH